MTHTQQIIQDAIEGGYDYSVIELRANAISERNYEFYGSEYAAVVFLAPLFWQAVGKTRGWYEGKAGVVYMQEWKEKWHRFIDHLAEGYDYETALSKLL